MTNRYQQIVDMVEGAAPQPPEADGGDFAPPSQDDVPPPDDGGSGGDPKILEACAALDQNDTDNGKRLLAHFGGECLFVREVGWHTWVGTHWEYEGGQEGIERLAQETARRIKLEALHIKPSPRDLEAIALAESLMAKDPKDFSAAEKALFLAGARDVGASAAKRHLAALWVEESGRVGWSRALEPFLLWKAG